LAEEGGLDHRNPSLSFRRYGLNAPPHVHDDHDQSVLPRRGVMDMEVEGRGGRVSAAGAILAPAGARHACAADGDNLFVVVDIPPALSTPYGALRDRVFLTIDAPVRGLLDYLAGEAAGPIDEGVAALWTPLLLRALSRGAPSLDPRLARAVGLIEARHHQPLSVADLAREAGMSQSRFFAAFGAALGQSPHTYLADARLRAAQRLLDGTALSVAEIAVRTGHGDQSALTRRMRAALGVTPQAYRVEKRRIAGLAGTPSTETKLRWRSLLKPNA
jgi:AraC-like DNA-binding protein